MTSNPCGEIKLPSMNRCKIGDPVHKLTGDHVCNECQGTGYLLGAHRHRTTQCNNCQGFGGWMTSWYFWDETWSNRHGPYETEKEARAILGQYVKQL